MTEKDIMHVMISVKQMGKLNIGKHVPRSASLPQQTGTLLQSRPFQRQRVITICDLEWLMDLWTRLPGEKCKSCRAIDRYQRVNQNGRGLGPNREASSSSLL